MEATCVYCLKMTLCSSICACVCILHNYNIVIIWRPPFPSAAMLTDGYNTSVYSCQMTDLFQLTLSVSTPLAQHCMYNIG